MSQKHNVFAHLDNVTEISAVRVTQHTTTSTTYTHDALLKKTKPVLIDLAETDFGLSMPYRTSKPDMIKRILDAQNKDK